MKASHGGDDGPSEGRTNLAVMVAIGAHVDSTDPLTAAEAAGAAAIQFFLADPQGWKAPVEHPHAGEIRASGLTIYIHAPYLVNVATMNNKIRIPSRKILAQHAVAAAAIGAKGLIVHGGHVLNSDDYAAGFDNWRKTFARQQDAGGFGLPLPFCWVDALPLPFSSSVKEVRTTANNPRIFSFSLAGSATSAESSSSSRLTEAPREP